MLRLMFGLVDLGIMLLGMRVMLIRNIFWELVKEVWMLILLLGGLLFRLGFLDGFIVIVEF